MYNMRYIVQCIMMRYQNSFDLSDDFGTEQIEMKTIAVNT